MKWRDEIRRTVRAKKLGSNNVKGLEIHDTVLIAAAFCMFNRYVDGLATWTPSDPEGYRERGKLVATHGYASVARLGRATEPSG